ncbi:hypothetical protein COT66_00400 [Candidatus Shapirobacteria bacterium CG09_land_8_20_14_0_10_49_15]|uniref:DUF5667 domain-containing protein n=2 Tax=Candidatus Shapironibacteriota TaxID=1752721 RepID=A0A2M8L6Z8_9BACT|nr:MAG: hypothetical protein COT66_00400 [Candidatus Shapirobacteria bacterium CG09_land_8_20_14_0_10_49_15]PJE70013.1 MAG: hypothetical protein COU97_01985 [Candidatus Shapirobacteria bacterium CG10_big_fil_rev_8_21_14_0_10_48_15]
MLNIGSIKNNFFKAAFLAVVYVLPYPGLMPGHHLYPVKQLFDQAYAYFAFGSFARHKYELALADKKLVEMKVLFEYRQYLLALTALDQSNNHFQKAVDFVVAAQVQGKNIQTKMANLQAAAVKHQEVLESVMGQTPADFWWQPEKDEPRQLAIHQGLQKAISIRQFK